MLVLSTELSDMNRLPVSPKNPPVNVFPFTVLSKPKLLLILQFVAFNFF